MGYGVLDSRLGYLVERYAVGVRGLKVQYLLQVPGYSFSLAVLIGGEPDSVSLAGFLAKRVDQMQLGRLKYVVWRVAVLKINADVTLAYAFYIAYVTL